MMSGISGMGSMPNAQMMAQMQSKMFAKADGDGSRGLDIKEFSQMVKSSPMGSASGSDAKLSETFGKLDTNRDGSLSKTELDSGAQDMMAQFKSTVQSFSAGDTSSSDKSLQTLLDSLGKASESGNSGGTQASDGEGNSLKQFIQQMMSKLDSAYGASSSKAGLSLQA
jgi:hypothetical protein